MSAQWIGGARNAMVNEHSTHNDTKTAKTSFERLPSEIIELILYLTDADTFASLTLLNRRWRAAADRPHLYAHHLTRCPSSSSNHNINLGASGQDDMRKLRHRFATEVRRNLFEAYLRPRRTCVKLISTSASSSAAFPGGEALHFSFSPSGHHVLALSSSRIYVVDLTTQIPIVKREFKILRRPVSATILDDASVLAVLSTDHQVNIYDLKESRVKHIRPVPLDNPPRTISLSPRASVLAAAYDGGIEVYSLASTALVTDRRAVKCDAVDSLAFSNDGTMLLGTTQNSPNPNTVVISAPYYTEDGQGASAEDILSQMWTTQILFPSSSRDCSHATLLPHHTEGQVSWTFTHDRVFETFRAVRVDDLRNGTTYFTGPNNTSADRLPLPSAIPAANEKGELIAAGFSGKQIWLYGVPEALESNAEAGELNGADLDALAGTSVPDTPSVAANPSTPSNDPMHRPDGARRPQWQVLVDGYRNTFVRGRKVASMDSLSSMRWVARRGLGHVAPWKGDRLVAVAPGGVRTTSDGEGDEPVPVDGGRILILDFEQGPADGECKDITIELGDLEPETLEEESRDLETEVALFRRRTVVMGRSGLAGNRMDTIVKPSTDHAESSSSRNRSIGIGAAPSRPAAQRRTSSNDSEGMTMEEAQAALDVPYSHNSPRSRTSLYRAATAATISRRQSTPSAPSSGRIEHQRPGGRRELPHESDADNWVPPPPPYTRDPEIPLPPHLQESLLPLQTQGLKSTPDLSSQSSAVNSSAGSTTSNTILASSSSAGAIESSGRTRRPQIRRGITNPDASIEVFSTVAEQEMPLFGDRGATVTTSATGSPTAASRSPLSDDRGVRRRPLSASAYLPASLVRSQRPRALLNETIPERHTISGWRSFSTPASPARADPPWREAAGRDLTLRTAQPQLTLSGSNLQERLNYPVPPAPPGDIIERHTPSPPPEPEPAARRSAPPVPHGEGPHVPVLPSAEQLANLQNRYSHPQSRIVPRPPSAVYRRHHGQASPGPPRGALGATSRSPSPSGGQTLSPSRAISRSNSRGSTRSNSGRRASQQRPDYRRLDTIHSVASYISQHSLTGSRSREVTTTGMVSALPKRVPSRAERSAAVNVQAARRSGRLRRKKRKDDQGQGCGESDGQDWTDLEGHGENGSEGKKKGSKCTVM